MKFNLNIIKIKLALLLHTTILVAVLRQKAQGKQQKDYPMTVLQIEATTSQLENDLAFKYSIANNDVSNLQMVLRAYGLDFTYATAQAIIAHNSH